MWRFMPRSEAHSQVSDEWEVIGFGPTDVTGAFSRQAASRAQRGAARSIAPPRTSGAVTGNRTVTL
jgi:hypothetical protein